MARQTTYLHLRVGEYRLAVRTECVRAVHTDLRLLEPDEPIRADVPVSQVEVRGQRVPFLHIGESQGGVFAGPRWMTVPYVVILEADDRQLAVGADDVDYLYSDSTVWRAVPGFGIHHPKVFEGAVRDAARLSLVLSPAGLSNLLC